MAIDYLELQYSEILAQERQVCYGLPEAAHEMCSATHRLRSALDICGHHFDAPPRQKLGHELKWLAKVLGRDQDAEVARKRLQARCMELPRSWQAADVSAPIEQAIGAGCDTGRAQVLQAFESTRYIRLLEDIARFRETLLATGPAFRSACTEVVGLVNNQARSVARADPAIARTPPGYDRDIALHRLGKATKQRLHAAEPVAGIHPKHVSALARTAHRLQRILGNH